MENPFKKKEKVFDEDSLIEPLDIDKLDLSEPDWKTATVEHDLNPPRLPLPTPAEQFENATKVPDYVEHLEGVGHVGMLSAAAIVQQYETAIKSIEDMGKVLVEVARCNEKSTNEVNEALKYVEEVAEKYREEAKLLFKRIEESSLMTAHVREVCDTMMKKIENPSG